MPVNWIDYKGKRILHADFRGQLKPESLLALYEETERQVMQSPAKVLMLIDVSNAAISQEFMNRIKANSSATMQSRVERIALVGINGLKKILVDGYMRVAGSRFGDSMKVCESEEEAKRYLAGEKLI